MPELPEVQTVVNYIKPMCVGKRLTRVKPVWSKVLHNFNEGFNSSSKDNKVRDVYRRAKFIIIAFEDDQRIRRALSVTNNIEFYRYRINFSLKKVTDGE